MREDYDTDQYALQLLENTADSIKSIDLPKDLQLKLAAYAKGIIYSSFFAGDSGTGKTTLAKVIGHKLGLPTLSLNFSSNIEESDVIGTWISNVNKSSPTDPEFVWKDGLLTKAIRNGYLIILEEINFARPGILGKLNSLLDETRQIDLPTGDIVKAHKNFRMIVTGNIGYEGTNLLNLAFINRYDYIREFSQMTIDEIENIIKTKTGYKDNTKISSIMQVYLAIKKYSNENKLNLVISVRQLINLFKQSKYHATAYDAVINTLVNTAFLQEQEHREHFIASVLPAFALKFKL
jgi:midasin (ATPase involved in ribosome maturation)